MRALSEGVALCNQARYAAAEVIRLPTLHVRGVPTDLYKRLKAHAETEGRSLSVEVLVILERALARDFFSQKAVLQSLNKRRRFSPAKVQAPASVQLLREDRAR